MSESEYISFIQLYYSILNSIENKIKLFIKHIGNIWNIIVNNKYIIILFNSLLLMFLLFNSNKKSQYLDILPITSITDKNPKNLNEIFNSRILYIRNKNITNEYIQYVKPVKNKNEEIKNIGIKIDENYFKKRKDQLNFLEFGLLCAREELLYQRKITLSSKPLISIIVPSYNKNVNIIKSIRSIQNQSLNNIEIIIVDDCSNINNILDIYNNILITDPRIRIFFHSTNMGVWRTRIDGFLYSRGKYIMTLDPDDLYEDNYVLEDMYNLMEKYELDSAKMLYRLIYDFNNFNNNTIPFEMKYNYNEIVSRAKIDNYNLEKLHFGFGVIWNRITRSDVYAKGLTLLSDNVLNLYKNFCDDQWWNRIGDESSNNFLIVKRIGYLYYQDPNGPSRMKMDTDEEKDSMIQEHITFLYFDYEFLPKENNKKDIINKLYLYNRNNTDISLKKLKSKYYILDNILNRLVDDPYVTKEDKIFVYELINDSRERQLGLKK